jgi:hypothetical protein
MSTGLCLTFVSIDIAWQGSPIHLAFGPKRQGRPEEGLVGEHSAGHARYAGTKFGLPIDRRTAIATKMEAQPSPSFRFSFKYLGYAPHGFDLRVEEVGAQAKRRSRPPLAGGAEADRGSSWSSLASNAQLATTAYGGICMHTQTSMQHPSVAFYVITHSADAAPAPRAPPCGSRRPSQLVRESRIARRRRRQRRSPHPGSWVLDA